MQTDFRDFFTDKSFPALFTIGLRELVGSRWKGCHGGRECGSLKERNEAFETERLALVKQTLEVKVFLKSVKQKVNTMIDISDHLEENTRDDDAIWTVESAQMLEEKEELVSRLIVQFYFL